MSSENETQQIEALEKRIQESQKALDELKLAVEKLPQPSFTSEPHERIYDAALALGLTKYVSYLIHALSALNNALELRSNAINFYRNFCFRFSMKRAPSDYYTWTLERRRYV